MNSTASSEDIVAEGTCVTQKEKKDFLSSCRNKHSHRTSADDLVEQELNNLKGTAVITKISKLNGVVNLLDLVKLQKNLQEIGVDDCGSSDSCRRRLKFHLRNQAVSLVTNKEIMNSYYYDCICVVDFEATCERDANQRSFPSGPLAAALSRLEVPSSPSVPSTQEIIEFPAHLVDVKTREIVSSFHSFVKPSKSTNLSSFCTELTGITQAEVDVAQSFPQVLDSFEDWLYSNLKKHSYESFAFATDGSWDFAHFFANSCLLNEIPYPSYAKRWINIRKVFTSHYKIHASSLNHMLNHLGMEFEGRKHSGLDDSKNIARVLTRMLLDGASPVINERISWRSSERSSWAGMNPGVLRVFYNKPSDGLNHSDSEDELFEAKYSSLPSNRDASPSVSTTATSSSP
jgi:3'-5' exoribonuclease 1